MGDCCPTGGNSIMKTYLNVTFEIIETKQPFELHVRRTYSIIIQGKIPMCKYKETIF